MKRLAMLVVCTLASSASVFGFAGGIHAVAQQSPNATEIHRAHKGSFAPQPDHTIYILILGSDSGAPRFARGGTTERGRSDSIHILAINPQKGAASLVGIPRDAYVSIPGNGTNKINAAMAFGGPQLAVQTVEGLAHVRFDYYMVTNFDDFITMAYEYDKGLTIAVPFPMHDKDSNTDFDAGVRHLDAGRLLGFARNRHNAPHGDFDRSLNQGRIMTTAQADARKRVAKDPTEILRFLKILRRHIKTDIPLGEQLKLGMLALRIDPHNVRNLVCSGQGGTKNGASVVILDCGKIFADVADDGILQG